MKLLISLLKPYMSHIHVRIIDRLVSDNDRLNQMWKEKYLEMEREMWYWKDRFMDTVYEPDKKL